MNRDLINFLAVMLSEYVAKNSCYETALIAFSQDVNEVITYSNAGKELPFMRGWSNNMGHLLLCMKGQQYDLIRPVVFKPVKGMPSSYLRWIELKVEARRP